MNRISPSLALLFCASAALAQGSAVPPQLQGVEVIERLGDHVPETGRFVDSEGRPFQLADVLHQGKPLILALVYYQCPALCHLVLSGLTRSLHQVGLKLGEDYRVATVSIDPSETARDAAQSKRGHMQALGAEEHTEAWTFATGEEPQIKALAAAAGFQFKYDAPTRQFAHSAVIFVLSPDGKLARYFYGIDYPPRDMRFALVEASHGKVGTTLDRVLMTCFRYDPATRRYGPYVFAFIRLGALSVFFALVALLTILWRQDLKAKRRKERGATV